MNIRYPIYEGVYRILTIVSGDKITIFVLKYSDYEKVVIDSHVLSPFVSLLLYKGRRYGWRKRG